MTTDPTTPATVPLPPATLVIFGATGDLTARLLMPALITLRRQELIGPNRDLGDRPRGGRRRHATRETRCVQRARGR